MHTCQPVTMPVDKSSSFSFLTTVIPHFFDTTCTRHNQGLSEIAYMNPVLSHLRTYFFMTSFIAGFNRLWCSMVGTCSSSIKILCMQMEGLIPFISFMDQENVSKLFSRMLNSLTSISLSNSKEIIIGFVPSFPKNSYSRPFGSSFNTKSFDVFLSSSKPISPFTSRASIVSITYGVDDTSSQSNSSIVRDFNKHFSSESLSL